MIGWLQTQADLVAHDSACLGTMSLPRELTVLLWFIPTIGVFITSCRTNDAANSTSWWHIFADPADLTRLTLHNYRSALNGRLQIGPAFINNLGINVTFAAVGLFRAGNQGQGWQLFTAGGFVTAVNTREISFEDLLTSH